MKGKEPYNRSQLSLRVSEVVRVGGAHSGDRGTSLEARAAKFKQDHFIRDARDRTERAKHR